MKKFLLHFRRNDILSEVFCGHGIAWKLIKPALLNKYSSVFVVIDRKVKSLYYDKLLSQILSGAEVYQFPSGERHKSESRYLSILKWLHKHHADRHSLLIAVGGGVVTDITGFAASCYMRGIDFLSVPTTLVGQVDAAIGGKTAINLNGTKNIVGTFYPPIMTINDQVFLKTLDKQYICDGMIEALKAFVVWDERTFNTLAGPITPQMSKRKLSTLVADAVRVKTEIVNRDPFEKNIRKALNFGHTTGHAYEALTGVSHGKAVAFGMIVALQLSVTHLKLNHQESDRIGEQILSIYPKYNTKSITAKMLWNKILHDKKRSGDEINFVLLKKIGKHQVKTLNYEDFKQGFDKTLEWLKR